MIQQQTKTSLTLLKHIMENFPDGVFTLNSDLKITYVNPAFCQLMGYKEADLLGSEITTHLQDLNILAECQAEINAKGFCQGQETIFKRADGAFLNISKNVQTLVDEEGKPGLIISVRDLTPIHQLNSKLTQTSQELEHYNQYLSDIVAERTQILNDQMAVLSSYKKAIDVSSMVSKCALDKRLIEVNDSICERSGYQREELIGQACTFLWSQESKQLVPEITEMVLSGKHWNGMVTMLTKAGTIFYLEAYIVPISNESGEVIELVNISHDVTPLMETTQALSHRLHYDSLTELPNRVKLLADAEASNQSEHIILFNVDSFNEINTFYGHYLADKLLKVLARKFVELTLGLPAQVYKLPIDEFAIVIKNDWARPDLEHFVQGLLEVVSARSFKVGLEQINLTLTAGLASSNALNNQAKDALVAADMALKMAKRQRKPFVFYESSLNIKQSYENNLAWIKRLRSAMEEDRLVPFFQPVVNAKTLKVDYYECLVRIVESDGQVVSPFNFLETAKKLKLYPQLTRRMLDKAFEKFAEERDSFSINLSIEDIVDPVTSAWIIEKVSNCSFAERVIFEIVESEGIQNYDVVNHFIRDVKQYGVKIAIDDFGAGYSNFIYIMRLDVDFIKIDGSIIRDIQHNKSSQVITETIINFARKLNIQTVAEFVADESIYDYVKHLEIDNLQGYLFGKPENHLLNAG
ncbi:bifunctional diguanylate cyclase/phosphodiesterase [Thiomicrospira pelophila]|uniref:bifunctional diguanylate cyclase/phosphodiesterase n=1 Tax=Thiomicrospira pelophila TaxID=934 RepID=UPI00068A449E|nr:EAL domain-containing protein [Thiomicrospira pelophila]